MHNDQQKSEKKTEIKKKENKMLVKYSTINKRLMTLSVFFYVVAFENVEQKESN